MQNIDDVNLMPGHRKTLFEWVSAIHSLHKFYRTKRTRHKVCIESHSINLTGQRGLDIGIVKIVGIDMGIVKRVSIRDLSHTHVMLIK